MGTNQSNTRNEFRNQWTRPSDVFSILLILGGDVIRLALANLTGRTLTPIAFSFGWVAYALSAVLDAISDGRLLGCPPEVSIKVFNLKSGYARGNRSWLLGRLMKNYDYWMPKEVKDAASGRELDSASNLPTHQTPSRNVGLCIAVYRWVRKPGSPSLDALWWSGIAVTIVQLGVAAVPLGLDQDWSVFLATAAGTLLSYLSASLPQWRTEKFQARKKGKSVAITQGNGSKHVVVVLAAEDGLDLEDLAGGQAPESTSATRVQTVVLLTFWFILLITCTGITTNTWYLLAVGGLGILHNLLVAGMPRYPAAMGLPLELVTSTNPANVATVTPAIFAEPKVMWSLMEFELAYSGYGKALLHEFFPGQLRAYEREWWESSDETERRRVLNDQKLPKPLVEKGMTTSSRG